MSPLPPSLAPRAAPDRPGQAVGRAPGPVLRIGIDRVTLHGFARADQRRFAQSLQTKLTELAAFHRNHDWSTAGQRLRIRSLDAGRLRAGASAEDAARQIATALFAELTGRGKGARRV
jgi:hypothetical protein